MATEYCPTCRQARTLRAAVTRRKVTDPDGTVRQLITTSYACEACHRFVRSEERDATPAAP